MSIVAGSPATRRVRFGTVTVSVGALEAEVEARNIKQGQRALKRASKILAKPGVMLVRKKSVPFFRADPNVPGRVIRFLNGKQTSGTFDKRGAFKVLPR